MPSFNTKKRRGRIFNRRNKKNNTRRAKSVEAKRKNTSEEIGSGGYGIVSRPAKRCDTFLDKNFNKNVFREKYYNNPNYISKLTEFGSATRELEIGNAIKEKIESYKDYFCLVEFICNASDTDSISIGTDTYDTYAISPYCGIPFSELLRQDIIIPMNVVELCYLVTALQTLIKGIKLLHSYHIYHKDIHTGNILIDSETLTLRLIDFGLSENHSNITNNKSPIIFKSELIDLEMIVNNIIEPFTKYLLGSRINDIDLHDVQPIIKDFYEQIVIFDEYMRLIKNPRNGVTYNNADDKIQDERLLNIIHEFNNLKDIRYYLEFYS